MRDTSTAGERKGGTARSIGRYLSVAGPAAGIPALDGLRAIAILLVLLRHASLQFQPEGPILPVGGWDAASLAINGWAGVDLFFVLSGFLITNSLVKPGGEPGRLRVGRYFLKRFLRIAPLFYVWLAMVTLGAVWFYRFPAENLWFRVGYHCLFLMDYLPSDIVVPLWSLGVEEKFYLLAPLIFLPLARARNRYLAPLALLALVSLAPVLRALTHASLGDTVNYGTFFRELRSPFIVSFDGMLAGAACAFLVARRAAFPWLEHRLVAPGCLAAGVALVSALLVPAPWLSNQISRPVATLTGSALAAGFSLVLLGCVLRPWWLTAALSGRFLRFYAKLAYGLYLTHWVFVEALHRQMLPWMAAKGWGVSAQFLAYTGVFVPLCTAFAVLMHWTVEKPFLLVKERIR